MKLVFPNEIKNGDIAAIYANEKFKLHALQYFTSVI